MAFSALTVHVNWTWIMVVDWPVHLWRTPADKAVWSVDVRLLANDRLRITHDLDSHARSYQSANVLSRLMLGLWSLVSFVWTLFFYHNTCSKLLCSVYDTVCVLTHSHTNAVVQPNRCFEQRNLTFWFSCLWGHEVHNHDFVRNKPLGLCDLLVRAAVRSQLRSNKLLDSNKIDLIHNV